MSNFKKVLGMFMVGLFTFIPMFNVFALTEWNVDSWETENGDYGSVTKVDDNIMNIKGSGQINEPGMTYGPYSYDSTGKVADGFTEEVYIELNKDNMADRELFSLSMSFNDDADAYTDEFLTQTQKVNDEYIITTGLDQDFKATITEDGVYTYRFSVTNEEGKAYKQFSVWRWDEEIATSKKIELPVTATKAGYMWFASITAQNGINVYSKLPEKPEQENPEETLPEEPVETEEPQEEIKDEVENPKTSDGIILTISALAISGVIAFVAKKKLA